MFPKKNNQYFIIASNDSKEEPIKVFDFKGNLIKEMHNSKKSINFINSYERVIKNR